MHKESLNMTKNTTELNKENVFLAYYLSSNEEYLTVLLPEKPKGRLRVKLEQHEKHIDADCYDKYELHALNIEFNEDGKVARWSHVHLKDFCDSTYFLAYLADGSILGLNGIRYKLYDNEQLSKNTAYSDHRDYMLSSPIDTVNNIKLWVKGNKIFGTEFSEDYVYRDSWSIEDNLFDFINQYDRYYGMKHS